LNYLIIGAGGTGGVIGWHMAKAGKDVNMILSEKLQQKIRL